ncbi:SIP domain-containing protein [Corynebacterium sp. USCH3]|uniref:SIP domain-containing protein n=1 Tax=Corynebacterium sp. USCH3 TaxID=3024840 RepID=UPI00309EAE34
MWSTLVCEVRGEGFEITPTRGEVDCVWLSGTGNGVAPSGLPGALSALEVPQDAAVWVATETRTSRTLRRQLREEKGFARAAATTMGYWVHDKEGWIAVHDALGEDFRDTVQALYASGRDDDEIDELVDALYEENGL